MTKRYDERTAGNNGERSHAGGAINENAQK